MLPGFRFLFAALVLSMSALVFGFGAAALLRTAHEEFANTPTWQPAPETRFVQSHDAAPPVLAMLRVDDPPRDAPVDTQKAEQPASGNASATPVDQAPAAPQAQSAAPAALQPAESSPSPSAKPEPQPIDIPVAENPLSAEAAAPTDTPATAGPSEDAAKTADSEPGSAPANEAPPAVSAETAAPEQVTPPSPPNTTAISTRIATLGGPPVTIEQPAKTATAKPVTGAVKKRQEARKPLRHRRSVSRARVARQTVQQTLDPFGQPITAAR